MGVASSLVPAHPRVSEEVRSVAETVKNDGGINPCLRPDSHLGFAGFGPGCEGLSPDDFVDDSPLEFSSKQTLDWSCCQARANTTVVSEPPEQTLLRYVPVGVDDSMTLEFGSRCEGSRSRANAMMKHESTKQSVSPSSMLDDWLLNASTGRPIIYIKFRWGTSDVPTGCDKISSMLYVNTPHSTLRILPTEKGQSFLVTIHVRSIQAVCAAMESKDLLDHLAQWLDLEDIARTVVLVYSSPNDDRSQMYLIEESQHTRDRCVQEIKMMLLDNHS